MGEVNLPHPSRPEEGNDPVGTKACALSQIYADIRHHRPLALGSLELGLAVRVDRF